MKDSLSIDIENYIKSNNLKMPETAHLTESRKEKAFRGFKHVVGAPPANESIRASKVKVKSELD